MPNTNLSCAITQLSATPNSVTSGSNVEISIAFSDHSCRIEPGDSIQVQWPSTGTAYLDAYNQTFPLIDNASHLILARVVVDNDHATITFTPDIVKLQNISGDVKFKAVAWNVTEGTEENRQTINIQSGDKSVPITIIKPQSTNQPGEFYSKTGAIWPNDTGHIYWYLNTNTRRESVQSPITLVDNIQSGQSIIPDSFMIYNTSNHEYYEGVNAITDFENAHPNSSISYNLETSTVTAKLSPDTVNGINWIIAFKTKMTDLSQQIFSNHSTINYWIKGAPYPQSLQSNASINNPYADGNISGAPAGTLVIKKFLDRSGSNAINLPISGVSFKLSRVDGKPITPSGETSVILTTDIAGEAKIPNLTDGEYQLVEVQTPDWLNPAPSPITFSMTNTHAQGIIQTIKNTKKITSISATKVWQTSEPSVPCIWFKLYRSSKVTPLTEVPNTPLKELSPGTTQVTWSDLEVSDDIGNLYTYIVKEVNAHGDDFTPLGYKKIEKGLSVTNQYQNQTTSLQISKLWNDQNNQDGIRPSSVILHLLANGKPTGQSATLSAPTWQYSWPNLPVYQEGNKITYTVEEDPISGYQSSYQTSSNGAITITNTHAPLTTYLNISKVWDDYNNQDGLRPDSVSVTLLADNQPILTPEILSDTNNWMYKWSNLPVYKEGKMITYTVKETPISNYDTSYANTSPNEITITNTHTPLNISIQVSKVWNDNDNQDGLRPDSVSVTLLSDGQSSLPAVTLSSSNNWQHTWPDLPVYKDGQKITYTVKETPISNYDTSYENTSDNLITITNTHTPLTTSMQVSKIWNDNDNQDGIRPDSVSVTLLADGQSTTPVATLSNTNTWKYTWDNVPVYKAGKKITYTVQEAPIPQYQTTYQNVPEGTFTITNTHTPLTTSVQISKVWDDHNNQDGLRPDSVSITLLENGQPTSSTTTLSADKDWQYKWTDLPMYKNGEKITYSVQETPITDYQTSYQNTPDGSITITNTHTPLTTSMQIYKVWEDNNNQDGLRPSSVAITLLADDQPSSPAVSLSATNNWQYKWTDLPAYKEGKKITYTVQETPIPEYQTSYQTSPDGSITITNTHTLLTTSLQIYKVWDDHNNQDGIRPTSVSVTLLEDGQPSLPAISLSEGNNWQYKWTNLPVYKENKKITYSVQEASIPNYETSYQETSGGTITITNTHTPLTTTVQVAKVWDDSDNQDGLRPDSISVTLLTNGQPSSPIATLSASNNWQYKWPNLPVYKNGEKITYTVKETPIPDYETSYQTTSDGTLTITNTHTPLTTSMQVSKTWVDNNNQDGLRPDSVSVTLLEDGQPSSLTTTLSASNDWQYKWSNLPMYKAGKPITYTVKEAPVPDYETSYQSSPDGSVAITNIPTPLTTSIQVSKVWKDNNNQDGIRPTSIAVTLLTNGQPSSPIGMLSADNNWQYKWYNLPLYQDGKKVTYTVKEAPVPGYQASYQTSPDGSTIITNTLIPATTSVEVSKVWRDHNNQAGLRPTSVSVTLLANGQPVLPAVTLTAENNWQYQWTQLPVYNKGMRITYAVEEAPVPHYQTSYACTNPNTITVFNTLTCSNCQPPHCCHCCHCCNNCNCCNSCNCCNGCNNCQCGCSCGYQPL